MKVISYRRLYIYHRIKKYSILAKGLDPLKTRTWLKSCELSPSQCIISDVEMRVR